MPDQTPEQIAEELQEEMHEHLYALGASSEGCSEAHACVDRLVLLARLGELAACMDDISCSNPPTWVQAIEKRWRARRDALVEEGKDGN